MFVFLLILVLRTMVMPLLSYPRNQSQRMEVKDENFPGSSGTLFAALSENVFYVRNRGALSEIFADIVWFVAVGRLGSLAFPLAVDKTGTCVS